MPDANPDVRQLAVAYRDRLKAELAKVEDFLEMAEHLSASDERLGAGLLAAAASEPADGNDAADEDAEQPLNLFHKAG